MKHFVPMLLAAMLAVSCIDEPEIIQEEAYSGNEYASFDFKNTSATTIIMSLQDEDGVPFNGVKVTIWKV